MREFKPADYCYELIEFVQKSEVLTQREEFIAQYLSKADDTRPYCVGEGFFICYHYDINEKIFTEAAFLLFCFNDYEDNALECSIDYLVSNSDAEKYSELVKECEEKDFSFEEYLNYNAKENFRFLVEDSFTVQSKYDKVKVKETQEEYKDKKNDYDLKTLADNLYGNDTEWIFKGRQ